MKFERMRYPEIDADDPDRRLLWRVGTAYGLDNGVPTPTKAGVDDLCLRAWDLYDRLNFHGLEAKGQAQEVWMMLLALSEQTPDDAEDSR